jgi:hypothetical protein
MIQRIVAKSRFCLVRVGENIENQPSRWIGDGYDMLSVCERGRVPIEDQGVKRRKKGRQAWKTICAFSSMTSTLAAKLQYTNILKHTHTQNLTRAFSKELQPKTFQHCSGFREGKSPGKIG